MESHGNADGCSAQSTSGRKQFTALDGANFFLADVRDGLGPYLAIYLMTSLHWNAQNIGIAMSVMGVATVIAQTPAGALVDRTTRKRQYSIIASGLIATAAIVSILFPTYWMILGGQAVWGWQPPGLHRHWPQSPSVLSGRKAWTAGLAGTETFNHAGNVVAALLAGLLGYYLSPKAIFVLLAVMSVLSSLSIGLIQESDIDHEKARGDGQAEDAHKVSPMRMLLKTVRCSYLR